MGSGNNGCRLQGLLASTCTAATGFVLYLPGGGARHAYLLSGHPVSKLGRVLLGCACGERWLSRLFDDHAKLFVFTVRPCWPHRGALYVPQVGISTASLPGTSSRSDLGVRPAGGPSGRSSAPG